MNRIYLVGYMGAGKTTVAKHLASKLGWMHYDTDSLFEEKYHISISDFFHKYDEALFRKLESQVLRDTETLENAIISTGGGTPCFNENMSWMNNHGTTIFLKISFKTAVHRILHSKKKRPLAESKDETQLLDFVEHHYGSRMPFYEQAELIVKGEDLDIDEILRQIGKIDCNTLSL